MLLEAKFIVDRQSTFIIVGGCNRQCGIIRSVIGCNLIKLLGF